jgi:hypothetical protein
VALISPLALALNVAKLDRECQNHNSKACGQLAQVAKSPKERTDDRIAAIAAISDKSTLEDVVRSAGIEAIATAARGRINELLGEDFIEAVKKGDVKEMQALVAKGVPADPHSSAFILDGLQTVINGGADTSIIYYHYSLKNVAGGGSSHPMMTAIRSANEDAVRALLALGADVKRTFIIEDASTNFHSGMFPVALNDRIAKEGSAGSTDFHQSYTLPNGLVADFKIEGGQVLSPVRPAPERMGTYLSVAAAQLSVEQDDKKRQALDRIMVVLKEAANPPAR